VHWDPRANIDDGIDDGSFDPDIRPETKRAQEAALFDKVGKNTYKWQTWNPVGFDPNRWIDVFVASGVKYFTFTTVHMHGFCNFDSPVTDFDIMSTEYKQDIVEQLAKAAEGRITAMWYFGSNGGQDGVHIPKELWPKYYQGLWRGVTTYDQLRAKNIQHLITNTDRYGKVAGIWWDGGGKWNMDDPANKDFFKPLFDAQPWLIMSPRCGHPEHKADWRCTEQRLGGFNRDPQWEMCIPIESSVWFWSGGKEANTKDFEHCTKLLVMCTVGRVARRSTTPPRMCLTNAAIGRRDRKTPRLGSCWTWGSPRPFSNSTSWNNTLASVSSRSSVAAATTIGRRSTEETA
jgi:hypothetical protein